MSVRGGSGRVVVGVDGSACAKWAVVVAPDQTGIDGWRLELVTACADRMVAGPRGPGEIDAELGHKAEVIQREALVSVPAVWVVRPSRARTLRVLALIASHDEPGRESLNDVVVDLATCLIGSGDGQLHVGHVWTLPAESTLRSGPFVCLPCAVVDMMVKVAATEHQARVDQLMDRHDVVGLGGHVHVVEGAADEVLPRLAECLTVTLVVMGAGGQTGVSGLVMGNAAETLLRLIRCSVLSVKPEGFVSRVRPDAPRRCGRHLTEVVTT